jgi:hypothetical protein
MVQLQDVNELRPSSGPRVILVLVLLIVAIVAWRTFGVKKAVPVETAVRPPVAEPAERVVPAVPSNTVETAGSTSATVRASVRIPAAMLDEAAALEKAGQLAEAREKYLKILEQFPGADGIAAVETKAGSNAVEQLMKPHPMPEKTDYVVAGGDTLDKIARKFASTKELLATNNLIAKPSLIKRGDRLRVFNGVFKVRVNKSRNDLLVTLNGRFFKRYRIGTGKFGKTPSGAYVISDRIFQPVWWRPDGKAVPYGSPDNILGTHWLALKPAAGAPPTSGYGIHGTWDDASIGKSESAGCVRMHNGDVRELYIMLPVGTEVVIEE